MEIYLVDMDSRDGADDDTISLQADSDEFGEAPETKKELESALRKTQATAFAKGTVKNLLCQWRSFFCFYAKYDLSEWPVPEHNLCLYAQFLAYNFKSARSVRSYLYGVRTLHVLLNFKAPNMQDLEIKLTFRGLNKWLTTPVKQAQPLTPEILTDMLAFLDLEKHADLVFWGSLLLGFFGMLRKSNLMPDTLDGFDTMKQLTNGHIEFKGNLAIIRATWTKTIQCSERVLEIPLFPIPGSPLCPVTVLKLLKLRAKKDSHPLLGKGPKVAFTYQQWQKKFRGHIEKGRV